MTTTHALYAVAITLGLAATPADAQHLLRPGKYEQTMAMRQGGTTAPALKVEQCLSADDIENMAAVLVKAAPEENCTVTDLKSQADRMTFTMACTEDDEIYRSAAELRFATDAYSGTVTTTVAGKVIVTTLAARRIGVCDPR